MAVRKVKGSWWVDFMYAGARLRKPSPHNSKASAEEFEVFLRQQVAQHGTVEKALKAMKPKPKDKTPMFAEFAERWLRDYVDVNNKPSERRAKRNALRNHLLPAVGQLRLNEITTPHVEQLKAKLINRGLSSKSINNYLAILRKLLSTALDWDLSAATPRIKALKSCMPEVVYLKPQEVDCLVQATPDGLLRSMIIVATGTGLRYCELIALEWSDVDTAERQICVRRSEVRNHVGPPKNNRIRYIPMSDAVTAALAALPRSAPLVFHRCGQSVKYGRALEELSQACARAGIRHASWHVLRHTFASDLARLGVSIQIIKELLGHATMNMTLRYAHLAPSALRSAIDTLDASRGTSASNRHLAVPFVSSGGETAHGAPIESSVNQAESAIG